MLGRVVCHHLRGHVILELGAWSCGWGQYAGQTSRRCFQAVLGLFRCFEDAFVSVVKLDVPRTALFGIRILAERGWCLALEGYFGSLGFLSHTRALKSLKLKHQYHE
jgi:hypothetical protein